MTNTPDEATLVSIKYNMNMLLALLPVNGKTEFDMGDASIMASVPSFVVMASAGAVPKALDYTLPRVPIAISDADIARIADAVRPAPGFTGGEVFGKLPATGPFPLNYGGAGGPGKIEVTLPLDGGLPE